MSTSFERRVKKLRERVLENERKVKEQEQKELQQKEIDALQVLKVDELKELANEKGIEGYADMKKAELIEALKG